MCAQRFLAFRVGIVLLSLIAVGKLFSIQILGHANYSARAYDQYAKYITINAKRGEILASDGYPLASNQVSYLLYAEPKNVPDKQKLIASVLTLFSPEVAQKENDRLNELLDFDLQWVALEKILHLGLQKIHMTKCGLPAGALRAL